MEPSTISILHWLAFVVLTSLVSSCVALACFAMHERLKVRSAHKAAQARQQQLQERRAFKQARERYCEPFRDRNWDVQWVPRPGVDADTAAPYATISRAQADAIQGERALHDAQLCEQATWDWLRQALPTDLVDAMAAPTFQAMVEVLENDATIRDREADRGDPMGGFDPRTVACVALDERRVEHGPWSFFRVRPDAVSGEREAQWAGADHAKMWTDLALQRVLWWQSRLARQRHLEGVIPPATHAAQRIRL